MRIEQVSIFISALTLKAREKNSFQSSLSLKNGGQRDADPFGKRRHPQ